MTSHVSLSVLVAALAAGAGLAGCSERSIPSASAQDAGAGAAVTSTPSMLATSLVTPSELGAGVTTTAPAVVAQDAVPPGEVIQGGPRGLSSGSKGATVTALENRLAALRFNPGKPDGSYDSHLTMAVMAFQKQQGMPRTGRADPATLAKLAAAPLGQPMVATSDPVRVEIDLGRQIAQFWKDGRLERVLAISSGNGARYCVKGRCDTAVTPGGSYRADRKIKGIRVSPLGTLYDPVYFYGGIAIHGSPSIPATPASHGCVRVPMWESGWVHSNVSVGDPVYVVGGKVAPVPFGETAPVEAPDEVTVPPVPSEAPPTGAGSSSVR